MKQSVSVRMKKAALAFEKSARKLKKEPSGWLTDNYYILEGTAIRAAEDCRKILKAKRGSEFFPGIFDACLELCSEGVIPDEKEIAERLSGACKSGAVCEMLPLALTCAVICRGAPGAADPSEEGIRLIADCVKSLRRLEETDFDLLSAMLNPCEDILNSDPAGIYRVMNEKTKNLYRKSVSVLARRKGKSERETALEALEKAKKDGSHIGKYICLLPKRKRRGTFFLIMEAVFPLICALCAGILSGHPALSLLLWLPLWAILAVPIQKTSLRGLPPRPLPSLDPECEKAKAETLVTVSVLLPAPEKAAVLGEHLETVYLGCRGDGIKLCCLADLKSASSPSEPGDKTAVKSMMNVIDSLNRKYSGGFILAVRPRTYSETQREFTGKERKRGAITDLVRTVKGDPSGFSLLHGDVSALHSVKYIAALDADTLPRFDGIRELIAIAEHPLNAPMTDPRRGRVVSGCGILVPHSVNRMSGNGTLFSRIMTSDAGISLYDSAACERYSELFGEGLFCGKGLINVDAFYAVMTDTLPKEKILSHDILEGGYLRAGFASGIQMTDSFPLSVGSYFLRLDRWIRGDWQNAGFIFGSNPLNALSRYKLFDNLRRSILPAACIIGAAAGIFIGGAAGAAMCAVCMIAVGAPELFSGLSFLFNSGFSALSALYFSETLPCALGSFARAFVRTVFSAREAFISTKAAAKALWRMLISKKNLLEWVTAAGGESSAGIGAKLVSCIPSVAAAVVMFFGTPVHRLFGMILLFDIPLCLFTDKTKKSGKPRITEESRETVLSYAAAMWNFFEEQCGRENNFLPPDNVRISPSAAVARRTSPTNIGLMLVSFLAARDMGFITTAELCMRLKLSLTTVEKLKKHKGNLLNWYSTETLEPLEPEFVSTVDSGNFLCCLVALKEGITEYLPECAALSEIAERTEKLIEETDLRPLYNPGRDLFYIGIDAKTGKPSGSCYDLFMSEARMTSYYAVATRLVPVKHWGSMGRITVSKGRYSGLVSWTGTMFEYFMPELFIPSPKGSILYESLHFCLYCQRKRSGKLPFGVSESGFYAFDSMLNYQYKAHGVQKIGLRQGLDEDYVVSPYSSFLTMSIAPELSVRNLKRLEKLGMTGKYGFYEAADFTRDPMNAGLSVVSSYMAHHIGMSLAAADNLLNENCLQRRFMSSGDMKGASGLLEEKIPMGTRPFRDIRRRETPAVRERVQNETVTVSDPDPFSPNFAVYSNGRMSCFISDCGTGVTVFDGADINVRDSRAVSHPQGVFAVFETGGSRIPFVKALDIDSNADFSCEFRRDRAVHKAEKGKAALEMTTFVLKRNNTEVRRFTVENKDRKNGLKGSLLIYFEPCIDETSRFSAHRAFSKLFISGRYDERHGCIVFRRSGNSGGNKCAAAAGMRKTDGVKFERSRERVLSSPNGVFSLGSKKDFGSTAESTDCCCAFLIETDIPPGGKVSYELLISADDTPDGAVNSFEIAKNGKTSEKSVSPFFGNSAVSALSRRILPCVMIPGLGKENEAPEGEFETGDLWSLGISGDVPIITVEVNSPEDADGILPYIRFNKILRGCGITTDLAVLYHESGGYLDPIAARIKKLLASESVSLMLGVKGGVHTVNSARNSYRSIFALHFLSAFTDNGKKSEYIRTENALKPLKTVNFSEKAKSMNSAVSVKQYNFTNGKISISKTPSTVDIPWYHIISGKSFGTMLSDKSLGFTWALNSGRNKITPWDNDDLTDNRGERLFLRISDKFYDIALISDVIFTPGNAVYECEAEGLRISVAVDVADKGMVKRCRARVVGIGNEPHDFEIIYSMVPVLGERSGCSSALEFRRIENGGAVTGHLSQVKGYAALQCSGGADFVSFSEEAFLRGNTGDEKSSGAFPMISVGRKISLAPGGVTEICFYLSWGATLFAAEKMPGIASFGNMRFFGENILTGNEKLDVFCNSFLYSQVRSCRFFARTGPKQCSGAYGFRDQLQDSLAFLKTEPDLTRIHLIRCAAVQYEEGDVLHWWHGADGKNRFVSGIRTRCSDDMLWLPYVFCRYLKESSDESILNIRIPYISGDLLHRSEKERYMRPQRSKLSENLLLHCVRAADFSLKFGENGLPLIGSCDWNDGFNELGDTEKGESVWLGMFQIVVLRELSAVCSLHGMKEKADEYLQICEKLMSVISTIAWEDDRFIRAISKDGIRLGKSRDFIDSLSQSFAVFSDIDDEKARKALLTAYDTLFDEKNSVIRLLLPPFDEYERASIGYIAEYPPGVRENGGQYTHGAVWLAMAFFREVRKLRSAGNESEASAFLEKAVKLVEALDPNERYSDQRLAEAYRAEPYVMPADVYEGKYVGKAGWTHFTGSAAWFYNCVCENSDLLREFYSKNKK